MFYEAEFTLKISALEDAGGAMEVHQDVWGVAGAHGIQGEAERNGFVQPKGEKAQGRYYCCLQLRSGWL